MSESKEFKTESGTYTVREQKDLTPEDINKYQQELHEKLGELAIEYGIDKGIEPIDVAQVFGGMFINLSISQSTLLEMIDGGRFDIIDFARFVSENIRTTIIDKHTGAMRNMPQEMRDMVRIAREPNETLQ